MSKKFGLSSSAKSWFFDRDKVKSMVDKKSAKALTKAGVIIRQRARKLIKKKEYDETSPAGSPPFSHETKDDRGKVFTLRNVQYAYMPDTQSVVVGPVRLNGKKSNTEPSGTVPSLHEFGGTARQKQKLAWVPILRSGRDSKGRFTKNEKVGVEERWIPIGRRARPGQQTRIVRRTYPKRPFMKPALEQAKPHLSKLWAIDGTVGQQVDLFGG